MQIVRDVMPKEVRDVVQPRVQDGAWFAHSEHLLLHLLASDNEEERRFAVKKILEIRGDSEFGDKSLRTFKVPSLNWSAKKIEDMISWEGATESILTANFSRDQIRSYLDTPFTMENIPCHTQSVERMVKEVSAASSQVYGLLRRDAFVHATIQARKVAPNARDKACLQGMLAS